MKQNENVLSLKAGLRVKNEDQHTNLTATVSRLTNILLNREIINKNFI